MARFNPLAALLGQQAAGILGGQPQFNQEQGITVTGNELPPLEAMPRPEAEPMLYNDAPMREAVDPRYILNDDRMAPRPEELDEILPRKGMFGVKGTMRDILGVLGDAFLVQSGNKAVYQPQRQLEKQGDAMFGFSENPMQAIERLATQNPELAAEVLKQHQTNQYQQGNLESLKATRESQNQNRAFDNTEVGLNRVSRWVKGGLPYEQVLAGASRYGLTAEDLAELGVTPDMGDEERARFAAGDMTVNQQTQVPFTERKVQVAERNATSGETRARASMINANRPRSSARPRADTELEYYRELSTIPANERTPEQKAFMRKYTEGTRGNRSSRINGAPPPPPPGGESTNRFRILNN